MPILLEDHDSTISRETIPIALPLRKYPLPECAALYTLISPDRLSKLVTAAMGQTSEELSNSCKGVSGTPLIDYDLVIESQRGFMLFGYPLFSHNLFPTDPPRLMTPQDTAIMSAQLYPLPSDKWHWAWSQWHVVMDAGDTDDQGWCYAWWFRASTWRGRMKTGIVRRRIWMRVRWRSAGDD